VLRPWNAAALPEIMAEDVHDSKLNVPEPHPEGEQQVSNWTAAKAEQQADNQEAQPETEAVELRNPTEA